MAAIYDGGSRTEAARLGAVGLQTLRDWALARIIEAGPDPDQHGVVRWRLKDLAAWVYASFGVSLDESTLGRMVKRMGFRKLSVRPRHHEQDPAALAAFKKLSATVTAICACLPPGMVIELWWQVEASIGQKNTLPRRWARRGTRPSAPKDQRTAYAYIFGAICPEKGKGAGLVLPRYDSEAISLHLAEISRSVAPRAHAVLILDDAGWHSAHDVIVPANIALLTLPPCAPELNPVENVWQFMRDSWLGDRIFASYDDIVDQCCHAWNRLIDQPWKIMSLGLRAWAYRL